MEKVVKILAKNVPKELAKLKEHVLMEEIVKIMIILEINVIILVLQLAHIVKNVLEIKNV